MTLHKVGTFRFITHDREEWQVPSRPIRGPLPTPELVHWCVCHWPGASNNWKPDTDVASHLRWANDLYLNDPNRGYSYGYSFVVGPNPIKWDADPVVFDTWEVRGFDIRPAANNGDFPPWSNFHDPNFNGRSLPIQIMCSVAYPATPDQRLQFRWMAALADQVYGEVLTVQPHRLSDQTSCPGDFLAAAIPSLTVRPSDPTPPPPPPPPPSGSYTVVAGDGWYSIARKVGCSVSELLAANPPATLTTVLHPGDVLHVPGAAPTPSTDDSIGVLDMAIPVARSANGTVWFTTNFRTRYAASADLYDTLAKVGVLDITDDSVPTDPGQIGILTDAQLNARLGQPG